MKNVDKLLTLKVITSNKSLLKKQKSVDRYGYSTCGSNGKSMTRIARSNEDLDENGCDNSESRRSEDAAVAAKMAEEAYAANLKMLKKQKVDIDTNMNNRKIQHDKNCLNQ